MLPSTKRSQYMSERLCIAAISPAISVLLAERETSCFLSVVSLWGHTVYEANLLSCEDVGFLLHISGESAQELTRMRAASEKSSHACSGCYIHTSFGGFPLQCSLSLSPPLVSRAMCMFSPSHPHTAASDSPHIKQAAYLYLHCVYQSGSHYSCGAAVKIIQRCCS